MSKLLSFLFIMLVILSNAMSQTILPTPLKVSIGTGNFRLINHMELSYGDIGEQTSSYASNVLSEATGFKFRTTKSKIKTGILFTSKGAKKELGDEGYIIEVTPTLVTIRATNEKGLFYGVQSLLQLLPAEIFNKKQVQGIDWIIPCQKIEDKPKFAWRSFMLDSGRQYQTSGFIKKYLEQMAMLKMNYFHWHLTEGQGWRIEIKKYPKLTKIGSQVAKGKEQQGFYTQSEIKDIVAFAKELHITVVPEIDVPGHSEAALTAYPELTCLKKAPESVMGFSSHIFCGGNEKTYDFLEDIFSEVCDLFPSEYIHIGGDEAPKADWKKCSACQSKIKDEGLNDTHDLQLYFTKRLANFLKTKNRKAICWGDVVYHDGIELPDNVVVYWWNWRGHKDLALKNAIKRGHQVICGTNYYTYLNFPVTPWKPRYNNDRTFDLKTCYEKNPSYLDNPNKLILGMGTCLWTDWSVQEYMIDQRVFPRIFALAEQMWNSGELLPFDRFHKQVKQKYPILKARDINLGPGLLEEVPEGYQWD